MPIIAAKFPTKCAQCRQPIAAGQSAHYNKLASRGAKMRCLTCGPGARPEQPPQPPQPKGATHEVNRFDSVSALRAVIGAVPAVNAEHLKTSVTKRPYGGETWFGVSGGFEAVEKCHAEGWADGVQRMLDALGKLTLSAAPTSIKRRPVRGEYGDEIDIHRVYCGDFSHAWTRRTRRQVRAPRVVTLVSDWNMSCSEDSDRLFWRGAAILRLADLLADAGYGVEIIGYWRALDPYEQRGRNGSHATYVTIKQSDDPVDLNSLAASICLSGTFRCYGFASVLSSQHEINGHIGSPDKDSPPVLDEATGSTILHAKAAAVYDEATATAWLSKAIEQIEADG